MPDRAPRETTADAPGCASLPFAAARCLTRLAGEEPLHATCRQIATRSFAR